MRKVLNRMDKPLLFMMILYTVFGLIMIFSASSVAAVLRYDVNLSRYFYKQLIFSGIAYLFGFFVVSRFKIKNYKNYIFLLVIGIIIALVGLFPYGMIINGTKSWYNLGVGSLQPSEFAKTILVMYMGIYFGQRKDEKYKYGFMVPLLVAFVVVGLVAAQPDLGGALIIAGSIFLTFMAIPMVKNQKARIIKFIGIGLLIIGVLFLYTGQDLLNSMQSSRLTFKNPCSRYTENTGYQVCNGFIAITNGGLKGVGLGNSTQKYLYLPEAHTDFIFPIIAEEFGAIVAGLVVVGYGFILFRILKIARKASTLSGSIICYGIFSVLLLHILINLLGVLALIPLTGVPLPFLSYGGSFGFNVIVMMFLVQRVAIETKDDKLKIDMKKL